MFENLPAEIVFQFKPGATIYMPGQITPTVIRGYGHMTLSFSRTDRPELLSIGLHDLVWRFPPFSIPIDIDRDGQLECIELRGVELNMNHLSEKDTQGTLNLRTGEMEIVFQYVISPKQFPFLEKLGGETIKFTVTDRGKMDLREGSFEIHSGVMKIEDWPLRGALIKGGGEGEISGGEPSPSTISLSIIIKTPRATSCGDIKQKSIIICPGDQIVLCWESSRDVQSVELDPGKVKLPSSGVYVARPAGPTDIIYRISAIGGNTKAEDTVEVHFYKGEWLGVYQALADGFGWSIELPPTSISGRLEAEEIELVQGCLHWRKFLVEHTSVANYVDFGRSIDGFTSVNLGTSIRVAGKWTFTAQLDPPNVTPKPQVQESLPVCFKLKGRCIK